MAKKYIAPGGKVVFDTAAGKKFILPGGGVLLEQPSGAPPAASPSPRTNIQGAVVGPLGGPVR